MISLRARMKSLWARSRRNLLIWGSAMVAALPFYEFGFIHDRLWLALIPLAGILIWKATLRR